MKKLTCRACLSPLGRPFLSLGNSPLSNNYLRTEDLHKMEPYYPLDLYVCQRCWLVQLPEFERAQNIFDEEYAYFSSYSTTWLEHSKRYVDMMIRRFGISKEHFVMEVASNDGYLLQYFKQKGIPVKGVEPAKATAQAALKKGIPTDIAFFDLAYARKMVRQGRRANLILGNNVLAHNPNLSEFIRAMKMALAPRSLITLEFPHLLRLIQKNQFDTIYHEHYSYFSLFTVDKLFREYGLRVFDVEELPTHGGSLRIFVKQENDAGKPVEASVAKLVSREKAFGLQKMAVYHKFKNQVESTKRNLLSFLIKAKQQGKRVAAYGAPAKGNTLFNYCGIRSDLVDYTVDKNPAKQGRFLPGTHISIRSPDQIRSDKPDYLLILPWNIREEIMDQMKEVRRWGSRFVTHIPSLKIHP